MKRNNTVIFDGLIQMINFHVAGNLAQAELRVTTDPRLPGGSHMVIANDVLAREALAFVITSRHYQVELYGTLYGWAYSPSNNLHVIVERAHFFVPPHIREQAVGVLKSLGKTCKLPEEVSFNGSRIKLVELLQDIPELQ